jgi:hypothetical protein
MDKENIMVKKFLRSLFGVKAPAAEAAPYKVEAPAPVAEAKPAKKPAVKKATTAKPRKPRAPKA